MKKMINKVTLSGYVYDHKLTKKTVSNQSSANYGKEFINGTLSIATDDEGLNVVDVHFSYVTPTYSSGTTNQTYVVLNKIIDSGKTVLECGMSDATKVNVQGSIALNDFYTDRSGTEELVSAKRIEGSFVTLTNEFDKVRNKFDVDILINNVILTEADPDNNIPDTYLTVKGATFDFRGSIMPMDFRLEDMGGINYFESLEPSATNMVLTKIVGEIVNQTLVTKFEQEMAFGEPEVREVKRNVRKYLIRTANQIPYEYGEEGILTEDEVKKALADREVYLASVKQRAEEYKAAKSAASASFNGFAATLANNTAASFDF